MGGPLKRKLSVFAALVRLSAGNQGNKMQCPVCGSLNFFVKDPDDEYETFEFELKDAKIVFNLEAGESDSPEVKNDTEVFCEKCSWHDKFQALKNN